MYFKFTERGSGSYGRILIRMLNYSLNEMCDVSRRYGGPTRAAKSSTTKYGAMVGNIAIDVDTRRIQNDHVGARLEESLQQVCTSLINLDRTLEMDIGRTEQVSNNYMAMGKSIEEKDKNAKVELLKVSTHRPGNAKQGLAMVLRAMQ